jgi:site-specific recombinase XerD
MEKKGGSLMKADSLGEIVKFPCRRKAPAGKKKRMKGIHEVKYFTSKEIRLLRRAARDKCDIDAKKGNISGIKEWMAIDLLTSTGLRVSEAADVCCGDIHIGYGVSKLYVRNGKGGMPGNVIINESLKRHFKQYLKWKEESGELVGEDDPLFVGQRGKWTSQAIQQVVKKYLRKLGLYKKGKSVHALRHSYGVELYAKQKDLRAVQKQLRHVSIQSTLVYADVTDENINEQIKNLWS